MVETLEYLTFMSRKGLESVRTELFKLTSASYKIIYYYILKCGLDTLLCEKEVKIDSQYL